MLGKTAPSESSHSSSDLASSTPLFSWSSPLQIPPNEAAAIRERPLGVLRLICDLFHGSLRNKLRLGRSEADVTLELLVLLPGVVGWSERALEMVSCGGIYACKHWPESRLVYMECIRLFSLSLMS